MPKGLFGIFLRQPVIIMKKIFAPLLSAALIVGGLFAPVSACSEDKSPKTEKPAKKKSGFFPFRGIIKAIDEKKDTITLPGAKGKPDRVFTIVKDGKLTLDGEKAKLSAIKVGMYIGGRAKKISDSKVEAHTLNVKTKAPEKKRKPAKKKEE